MGSSTVSNLPFRIRTDVVLSTRSRRRPRCWEDIRVAHEAHRQGKRVYRVDIDFRNAFDAMSQVALWHVMNMFHILDVDLLE